MCGFTCCSGVDRELSWACLKVDSSLSNYFTYLCGQEGAQDCGVGFVILAEAMVCPEESQKTSISLGWQEQAPLLFSNFMIRPLVFFLFI